MSGIKKNGFSVLFGSIQFVFSASFYFCQNKQMEHALNLIPFFRLYHQMHSDAQRYSLTSYFRFNKF